jgi:type I restriction enzyme S subunit
VTTSHEFNIPTGWTRAKLGEILEFKYGKGLTARDRDGNGYPVYGSNGVVGYHSEPLIDGPALVIGRKGSIGEVHLSSGACHPIDTTYYVNEFHGQSIRFWFYRLKHIDLSSLNRATALPGLNRQDAYDVELLVPPLPEQYRMVQVMEALFERTQKAKLILERVPAMSDNLRQSVLAAAFRGNLTEEWRAKNPDVEPVSTLLERIRKERRKKWEEAELAKMKAKGKLPKDDKWKAKYKEPEPVDLSGLPELPEGWCWTAMGQAFEVYVGSTPSRKKPEYWNGDIPWVSSGEVAFCRINTTNERITDLGLSNASTNVHPRGTVLLGMIGEGKTRGQAAILDICACHNQNSAAIRVSETDGPPEYIYYHLLSEYERTRTLGSGNNQPALNKSRVQRMVFPMAPVREQHEIKALVASQLEGIETVRTIVMEQLTNLDQLEQKVLEKAFQGELVPQDPNDEPASVLLDRIKGERNNEMRTKRRRPRRNGFR